MKRLKIRFYEELNDFLPAKRRKVRFEYEFGNRPSVKDFIESLGIPHTEVDLILVNSKPVNFNHIVTDGDDISVYPVFESFNISEVQHLRPASLRNPKFVLDVHLGKLARYMRMLGLDSAYRNNYTDEEIVSISLSEHRAVLTKDIGILKRKDITHGYYVRGIKIEDQLKEVINRFDLSKNIDQLTRCLLCNTVLERVNKDDVMEKIPPKVREYHNSYYLCGGCGKLYWPGSHYERMKKFISEILITPH